MAARTAACLSITAALLAQPVLAWQNKAQCVPGSVVKQNISGSGGTIGGYAEALQTMTPKYGQLVSISAGDTEEKCTEAAQQVNINTILAADAPAAFSMTDVTEDDGEANSETYYLYIFDTNFHEYEYIATCIPGGVVGTDLLNATKGVIAAYTIVLQALMDSTYGELWFLGQSDGAAGCIAPQDAINAGNASVVTALKKGKEYPKVKQVGMFSAGNKGNPNKTYMYVFQNKMWNQTWGMMAEPLISAEQQEYWAQTTPKPSRRRRKGRRLSEDVFV